MAYPDILFKGQNSLKRTLTFPINNPSRSLEVGDMTGLNAAGEVVDASHAQGTLWGVIRSINWDDNVCVLDFTGVHQAAAGENINAGNPVRFTDESTVGLDGVNTGTSAVSVSQAAAGEDVFFMFLN